VENYLDAHAEKRWGGAPNDWTITLAHKPAVTYRNETEISAFGERFRLARAEDGGIRLRHSDTPDQIWRIVPRTVDVVAPRASHSYRVAQSVYTAARQISLLAGARSGIAVIHAAAVAVGSGSILVCGDKGSGKTTLSVALLERGGEYMASDRTIAWKTQAGLLTGGWMGSFRIAPEALNLALAGARAQALRAYMAHRRSKPNYWFGGKFRFPPQDLLRLCGWSSRQGVEPRLLVELSPEGAGDGLVTLSRADAQALWRRHLVPGTLPQFGPWIQLEPPEHFQGVRLTGRVAPQTMADHILKVFERSVV
jgi:hypothetical protein